MIRTLFAAAGLAASAAAALAQPPDPTPQPLPAKKQPEPAKDVTPKADPPKGETPKTGTPKTDAPVAPKGAPLAIPGVLPDGSAQPPAPAAEALPVRTFADYPPSFLPPPGPFGYGTLPPRIPYGPSVSPLEYPYPLYSTPPGAAWPQYTPLGAPHGTTYGRTRRW